MGASLREEWCAATMANDVRQCRVYAAAAKKGWKPDVVINRG